MASSPWPVTINGKTFNQIDVDPYAYAKGFPDLVREVGIAAAATVGAVGTAQQLAAAMQAGPVASVYRRGRPMSGVVSPDPLDATAVPATKDFRFQFGFTPDVGTFTRSAAAFYTDPMGTLRSAASGVIRIDHDPVTGANRGALFEGARTNLITCSQDISNAVWTKVRCTVGASIIAPDGTISARKVVEDTTAANSHAIQTTALTAVAGTSYGTSAYVKKGERTRVNLAMAGAAFNTAQRIDADLANGTVTVVSGAPADYGIIPMGDGWYRIYLVATADNAAALLGLYYLTNNGLINYTGDGVSGAYVWGLQVEAGLTVSSYIPTAGATAARAAEALAIATASDWFNAAEMSLFVEGVAPWLGDNGNAVQFDDGANNNRLFVRLTPTNAVQLYFVVAGVTTLFVNTGMTIAPGNAFRIALALFPGGMNASLNGAAIVSGSFATAIPAFIQARMGSSAGGITPWNSSIRRFAYFPRRLPDSELVRMAA